MEPMQKEASVINGKLNENQNGSIIQMCKDAKQIADTEDTSCGIGKFKPQWLQKYGTSRNYLILYCVCGFIQGSYYYCLIGALSTLEKRFAFKSKISGIILCIDEISALFLGILVGYIGQRLHRPRVLAAGMYMCVLCCFLSALPYFLYGPSQPLMASTVSNETEFCTLEAKSENCEDDQSPTLIPVILLCLATFCKGFSNIAYYVIGLSYMDDSTKKENSPLYLAIAESMRLFGPILGFLMISACLKFYENPFVDPGYGTDDPRWIGAWWVGFTLQGIVLAIISFPFIFYPRYLRKPAGKEPKSNQTFDQKSNGRKTGIVQALVKLFKNTLYVVFMIGTIFSVISRFGFFITLPKYMEVQFRMSSSAASLISGPLGLVAAQVACLLGGWCVYKWKPTAKQLIAGHAVIELIWAVGMFLLIIPSCHHIGMVNSRMTENGLVLQNECNFNCSCSTRSFSPVCGLNGKSNYFTPCHAGCKMEKDGDDMFLRNCSCLSNYDEDGLEEVKTITKGLCKDDGCWSQSVVYITTFTVLSAMANVLAVSHVMILLRSIDPQDKSMAIGTFESIICALGFLPYPVIYGALADAACLVWESSCGKTGNCWYYDVDKFSYLIHGAAGGFSLVATICYVFLYPMAHKLRDLYKDDDELPPDKPESQNHGTFSAL